MREERIQNYISRMPSLSTTVTKVLEVCNSPHSSPNDLNRVISLDPVLTGHVLKLVNSAYYSLMNRVTSLTRAIIMLGLNTVKNLVLSTAVLERLSNKKSFKSLSMNDFWTHSICTGVTAKAIAEFIEIPVTEREEFFVAGLLHDLGKIPLNNCFPEEYQQVIKLTRIKQIPLYQVEKMVFGLDHCTVGRMIGDKWSLSQTIADSLCYHHSPNNSNDENRKLITAVALANTYANIFGIGSSGNPFPEQPTLNEYLESLNLDWSDLKGMHESVLAQIERAQIFLQITQKGKQ